MAEDRVTVEDAAAQIGVDPELLLGLCRHGRIPFVKHPDDPKLIMFTPEQVDSLLAIARPT